MVRLGLALGLVVGSVAVAHAQSAVVDVVEGAGVKVGEGTVLHPIAGIETGVIQNVFYEDSSPVVSGLLRVIGELAVGSLPDERMRPASEEPANAQTFGDLALRGDLHVQYEEYLSTNDAVQAQRNVAFAGSLQGIVYPKSTWQFGFADDIRRETRPVNFESSDNVDREINRLTLRLRFRPHGRTLSGQLSYSNVVDYFEDEDQQFANRIQHTGALGVAWQWLPMTRITGDVSLGFFRPLGSDSTVIPSMPLRITLGVASLVTVKTTVNGYVGFGKGFYESGPDFTNVIGGAQVGWRFSPQSRLALGYEYDFHDSINANFYRDHALLARLENVIDRFSLNVGAELRFRDYRGVIVMGTTPDRNDLILSFPVSAAYNFRGWIAATADYRLTTDQTDFRYQTSAGDPPDDPSYTQQVFMLGVRAAY